ncbi:MAG TPA: osmotically inducible protein OsmC [Balneola sp.]|jgi:putative redox protein|nr:osmotically inducible protein OsmC [Balneola sp.]MAO78534.1 osmotically inducible protein OsmC [Balneola sp.]MBF64899.1 osmotically inducible protein OsmC [Balneola sp.]HAH50696.1 osmotically inducible protein OsmC [Balneola sp.]HAW81869.1 osmotically inducible protein OsmC [Balneola sp.]|tara:strand:- start:5228 stop:5647 length:420 start_codon:yes stop_codon:yes gene_type:complete
MNITVNWLQKDFHMEAANEEGGKIRIDGNTQVGGLEGGISPMQLLLAGIGGCSAIDVISILEKQKQELTNLTVEVNADKVKLKEGYSEFKKIHLQFKLSGDLDTKKVERALNLSITKYCSVSKALEKGSEISYDYTIEK